jgi:cytochrome P450
MTKYPRVLRKAQEEVDRVVGRDRLPTFADWENLPYINCCVKECLRWRPVAVNGFPHCLTADVEYGGYLLPKGSTVLVNTWYLPLSSPRVSDIDFRGIHHDPTRYDNPSDFYPERYLSWPEMADSYAVTANPKDRDHYAYGAGRRICGISP